MKKAIIISSNGTTSPSIRKKTLEQLRKKIDDLFIDYDIFETYTSQKVINKLKKSGIIINTLDEVLIELVNKSYDVVLIQSVYISHGLQTNLIREKILKYMKHFKYLKFAQPLLNQFKDYLKVSEIIYNYHSNKNDNEAILLVGHGTESSSFSTFLCLARILEDQEISSEVGVLDGYPDFDTVVKRLRKKNINKVILMALMFSSYYHASKDVFGDKSSWKTKLQEEGFIVKENTVSLGEINGIQMILIDHLKNIIG